jgi:hypothetical protein
MADTNPYDRITTYGKSKFGLSIRFKDESRLMKVLGTILFFNPQFMNRYITVIGSSVYFPSRVWLAANRDSAARVLCHELVHVADERRVGALLFRLSYLFPQWLALLSLSSIVVGPWGLIFLLFLAPLPAPFRTFWELRGYMMTDAISHLSFGKFADTNWMASQFTTGSYYFMWPFHRGIVRQIELSRAAILDDRLQKVIPESKEIIDAFIGNTKMS